MIGSELSSGMRSILEGRIMFGVTDEPLNVNAATVDEISLLPGVSDTRAQFIVEYREEHGSFANIEDFMIGSELSPGMRSILEGRIMFGSVDE